VTTQQRRRPADAGATPPARIRLRQRAADQAVSQPLPVYPPDAKQARIQGVVKLNATIARTAPFSISSDQRAPAVDPAALDAVRQWVYEPTLLNGQPVEVVTEIDVNFTLAQ